MTLNPNIKSILLSRTAWVAAATFLAGLFVLIENTFPGASWIGYVVIGKSVIDLLLRLDTTTPVSVTGTLNPPKTIV